MNTSSASAEPARTGMILILSGPSGSGKSTIYKAAIGDLGGIEFSVSCTTRQPRPGEQEGVNYFEEIRWGTYQQSKFQGKYVHCGMNLWSKRGYEYDWYYVEEMWPWSAPLAEIQRNQNLKKRQGWVY